MLDIQVNCGDRDLIAVIGAEWAEGTIYGVDHWFPTRDAEALNKYGYIMDILDEGYVIFSTNRYCDEPGRTDYRICCGEKDKKVFICQMAKMLKAPKQLIKLYFYDFRPLFQKPCTFHSKIFNLQNAKHEVTEWIKEIGVSLKDILCYADGNPTLMQFSEIVDSINSIGITKYGKNYRRKCSSVYGISGIEQENPDTIRISLWDFV